jgi:long-chain acyl-CoA synthetase
MPRPPSSASNPSDRPPESPGDREEIVVCKDHAEAREALAFASDPGDNAVHGFRRFEGLLFSDRQRETCMSYTNLAELHRRQAERFGPRPALGFKRYGLYHSLSWEDYRAQSLACAAALVDVGIQPGDRVGLVGENRVEWLIADMAILAAGAINVPPHAPLTARQIHFQLEDAGVSWLFVSTRAQLDKIRQVRGLLPKLRGVVVMDRDAIAEDALSWDAFLQRGRRVLPSLRAELEHREKGIGPDSLATIMYTSGTTGNPKGVMLTHGNLVSNSLACLEAMPAGPEDVKLTWLPFSHIYARTVDHYTTMAAGVFVALAESADTVIENLAEVQPTSMSSVPRLYEKVLTAVKSDDPKKTARRLRDVFGPRIDYLSSGGAPLPLAIAQAYQDAGLVMLQGYGLTESSPVISFNTKRFNKLGTVGKAVPGVEIRIAPDGEVLTRGPHVMKGYWNNPEATAEAIRDGWLHTGDLGSLDAEGYLSITGRKKELLVLSNGKKVVPSFIEGLLIADPCIDQAVVCGEGRNFLTALLVPHWENVRNALKAEGVAVGSNGEDLAHDPKVRDLLDRRVQAALADVSSAEQVRKFLILQQPFTVAADELTVSLKLRRNVVVKKYASQLDALYVD